MGKNRPFIEFLYKFKASEKASNPIEFNLLQNICHSCNTR